SRRAPAETPQSADPLAHRRAVPPVRRLGHPSAASEGSYRAWRHRTRRRLDKTRGGEEALLVMYQQTSQLSAPETPFELPLAATRICRGVMRLLDGLGFAALAEFPLKGRRRADVIGLDASGEIVIVEVKSGRADFQSDRKWPEYLEFCDRFFFAVDPDFPREILPVDCGLIVAGPMAARSSVPRRRASSTAIAGAC